ncbi:MAG: CHASE4 domain-containing protein [Coleofasciculaceae cyanobacterium]
MTLRQKTLLIVGVTLFSLLIGLYLSLSTIWLSGFTKLESQQTYQNVERVIEVIRNDLMELSNTARDWSVWRESYDLAEEVKQEYTLASLQVATLANLRLNIVLFINSSGEITHGKRLDLQQKVAIPMSSSLKQYLATKPSLIEQANPNDSNTGIIVLPEGALFVATRPISSGDFSEPNSGTLLLGRFLNAAEVARLSKLTNLHLTIYPLRNQQLPKDILAAKEELSKKAADDEASSEPLIIVSPLNSERIAGYGLFQDVEGKPGLLLRVNSPRNIYQQGKKGLRYLLAALLIAGLIFGLLTLLLLEKLVMSRLAKFSATVKAIRSSGDLSKRLFARGEDELSQLGQAINLLLMTLQQSQQSLHKSQGRYRFLIESIREVIFQTDTEGKWTFLNPAWTEITGFTIKESLGKPCWKFVHPAEQSYHRQQFCRLIEGDRQDTRYEIRYRTKNGRYRWLQVNLRLILGSQGVVSGTAGTLNDVTERKIAQSRERVRSKELEKTLRELAEIQAQLMQSDKMSSLGQLVAGIAHEINNPISFVAGNINHANEYIQDLLYLIDCYQQHYPNPPAAVTTEMEEIDFDFLVEDLPKLLKSMKLGTDRICDIVNSLRNFSRLNESDIKAVDIHEGIDSTLLILQHRLKAKGKYAEVRIIREYGNLPLVECHPGQLNQVIMNLLANAIDALEEKRLSSDAEVVIEPPCIEIRTEVKDSNSAKYGRNFSAKPADATSIIIRIVDNGPGITEVVRRQLFKPFFTTKPLGKGTGLGLSISYRIVEEKHKGQLRVKSQLGQGTEFSIELPVQQETTVKTEVSQV